MRACPQISRNVKAYIDTAIHRSIKARKHGPKTPTKPSIQPEKTLTHSRGGGSDATLAGQRRQYI